MSCGVSWAAKKSLGGCGRRWTITAVRVLAYGFGRREDRALLRLKALLAPFGIRRFYTDGWGAYQRH